MHVGILCLHVGMLYMHVACWHIVPACWYIVAAYWHTVAACWHSVSACWHIMHGCWHGLSNECYVVHVKFNTVHPHRKQAHVGMEPSKLDGYDTTILSHHPYSLYPFQ